MTGFLDCEDSIWQRDDLSQCFRDKYIQTLLPLIIASASLLTLTLLWLGKAIAKRRRSTEYRQLHDVDITSDNSSDEDVLFTRADAKIPESHNGELFDRPRLETTMRALEAVATISLVVLQIVTLMLHNAKTATIVQLIYWSYFLGLVLLKNLRLVSEYWWKTVYAHSLAMIVLSLPLTAIQFRSVILGHASSHFIYVVEILQFSLVVLLTYIAFTSRPSTVDFPKLTKKGLFASHEPLASAFSLATFNWVDPVIWTGYKRPHTMDNIWDLREDDYAHSVLEKFTTQKTAISLVMNLFWHFRWMLIYQGIWALFYSLFTFVPTLLLRAILRYLEDPENTPREVAWLYCIGLLVGSMLATIGNGQALFIGRRICIKLRAIIIGEVYAKALRRRDVSAASSEEGKEGGANNGQIINLMAIDAFKVGEICSYLHYLGTAVPVELVIAVTLLYGVLGWSALAGIIAMVVLLPFNYWISKQFAKIQDNLMKTTDIRINRMNEMLNSIRIIKYFAWETSFMQDINECRRKELAQLKKRYIMFSIASLSWNASPVIITLMTFWFYTKIAKNDLTASVAFTALSLFNVLRSPLDQLADMISNVLQSKVSLDRVAKFLGEEETLKYEHLLHKPSGGVGPKIGFVHGTFTWATQAEVEADPVSSAFTLKNISIEFPEAALSVITGPTGSGKTSLLMALLGELTPLKGDAFLPGNRNREDAKRIPGTDLRDCVAYCAQSAWLLNDTIRNNILFADEFDSARYDKVVKACALTRDFEILDHGDGTQIGEKGITLSGGQKQRVSLARALYSKARHLLLDDCLSAVDSHTAKWIFDHALTGEIVNNRTVILVTHNISLCLPLAKHVIFMDNGRITHQGSPAEVLDNGALGEADKSLMAAISNANSAANSRAPSRIQSRVHMTDIIEEQEGVAKAELLEVKKNAQVDSKKAEAVQEETRAQGSVGWNVYGTYAGSLGGPIFWILIAAAFLGQQGFNILQTWWIREWALSYQTRSPATLFRSGATGHPHDPFTLFALIPSNSNMSSAAKNNSNTDVNYYLGVYGLIALAFCVITLIRIVVLSFGSIRASEVLHGKLLRSVMHAKMRFFDSTPMGRIMNRFSKDLETIDQEVSIVLLMFFHDTVAVIAIVVLITLITPGFLIAGALITVMYVIVGALYTKSSRELKRLESVSRSPIYQHFGETLVGATTIRAYGDELRFIKDNLTKIDSNNRPFYYMWACNRWLSIRVDVGGVLVSFFAAVFVILNVDTIDAGLAGVSLTYAITFTDHVLWVVRLYAQNEMNMNSVERISEYLSIDQEAPAIIEKQSLPKSWPDRGTIEVKNMSLRYAPDLPTVLDNITFKVDGGSKIGIVGRTGAGKSSIATAFFRMVELSAGSITIDGIDISNIGLQDLRQGLTIIPQDPTLFQRSLRFNLDPFNQHSDAEIFEALRRVHLIGDEAIQGSETEGENINVFTNLETPVAEGGNNMSQGQRQLLCLARALLRLPRVIFMDESTASVDHSTDSKIQKTIRLNFKHSTILTIAHRLRSICDYDKILVLDAGKVKEFDHPYKLMTTDSIFADMCRNSGEFDILLEMAKKAHIDSNLIDDTTS